MINFKNFNLDEWATITWDCGFDVSPETLYERATGKIINWLQQNQLVELPPLFQFEGAEVIIKRIGEGILLLPLKHSAAQLRALLESIDEPIELERNQPLNNDITFVK